MLMLSYSFYYYYSYRLRLLSPKAGSSYTRPQIVVIPNQKKSLRPKKRSVYSVWKLMMMLSG